VFTIEENNVNIGGPSLEGSVLMLENWVSRKWTTSFKCFTYFKFKSSRFSGQIFNA